MKNLNILTCVKHTLPPKPTFHASSAVFLLPLPPASLGGHLYMYVSLSALSC